MRLRGVHLLAVAASAVVALTFAGSAVAIVPPDPACGTTLIASFTLTADINCTGYGGSALKIGQAGITINLNGHTITGDANNDVIDNTSAYDGLTVENGTLAVAGNGIAVDNRNGGDGLTVSNVTITGGGSAGEGVYVDASSSAALGTTITGSTISGVDYGVDLEYTTGALVKGNTITANPGEYGVFEEYGTGDVIVGNTITSDDPQNGFGVYLDLAAGTVISGNTFTLLQYGVFDVGNSAGMMVTGNVFGGANPGSGNDYGIGLYSETSDVIANNYVRNSLWNGVYDSGSQNNLYSGNILTSSGSGTGSNVTTNNVTTWVFTSGLPAGPVDGAGFYVDPAGYGPVTMVNNYSRDSVGYGYYVYKAYLSSGNVPSGPYSVFTGNAATYNQGTGFYVFDDAMATWKNNTAYSNGGGTWVADGTLAVLGSGFLFFAPQQDTITNNSATLNTYEGFSFDEAYTGYAPLAVSNNSATYNGDFGFYSDYPVAASGNSVSNNGSGSCYLVSGCS